MNYLREINAFVDWLETNPLDAITQALWFHLMAINNKCNWPEWFAVANLTLQARLGVDKKTVIKHRNILIQKKLIEYKNQSKTAGRYKMLSVSARMGGINPPPREPQEYGRGSPLYRWPEENTGGNSPPLRVAEDPVSGNIPLEPEPTAGAGGNFPPIRGPAQDTGGSIPPNRPPTRGPDRSPLDKPNQTKPNEEDLYTIFRHWNAQRIITHRKLSDKQKGHIRARLAEGYTVDEILEAIDNYAAVLHGDEYYWTHRWRLDEFLLHGLDRFKSASDPRTNFLKDKSKAPRRAQGGVNKYAGYANRTVTYHDL